MNAPTKTRGIAGRIFKALAVLGMLGILGIATYWDHSHWSIGPRSHYRRQPDHSLSAARPMNVCYLCVRAGHM
jgi:hypothetical protein